MVFDVLSASRLRSLTLISRSLIPCESAWTEYGAFSPGSLANMLAMGSNLEKIQVLVRPEEIVGVLKALENNTELMAAYLDCIDGDLSLYLFTNQATQPLARIRSAALDLFLVNTTLSTLETRMSLNTLEIRKVEYDSSPPVQDLDCLFRSYQPAMEEWVSMARIFNYSADCVIRRVFSTFFYSIFKLFLNPSASRRPRSTTTQLVPPPSSVAIAAALPPRCDGIWSWAAAASPASPASLQPLARNPMLQPHLEP